MTLVDTFQHLCTGPFLLSKAYLTYLKIGVNFSKLSLLRFPDSLVPCNDRHFTVLMMNDCDGIEPDPFCILRKQDNHWMVKFAGL